MATDPQIPVNEGPIKPFAEWAPNRALVNFFTPKFHKFMERTQLGKYPKEFDQKIHGFYNPAAYYGKRDTPFSEVKLGELPAWFKRREKGLVPTSRLFSRAFWRYYQNWLNTRYLSATFIFQAIFVGTVVGYLAHYRSELAQEKRYRYH